MPGKIDNSAQLSRTSLLALQAERKEGVKTSSFWNKWSNLSTGQKWGRALAWIIPPLGIGIQAGANLWQARQAKIASARPEETKVTKSSESLNGAPLRSHIVFGKAEREIARAVLRPDPSKPEALVHPNGNYPAELHGLTEQYALDIRRNPEHTLSSHDGSRVVSYDKTTENKTSALRGFFAKEFPDNSEKAEMWAVFASKFLNQNAAAPNLAVTAAVGGFSVPRDYFTCKLSLEKDGNSALLEVRSNGSPNRMPGIDQEKSKVDNFLLMKITLGPPEDLQVISGYSHHNLVPQKPGKNAQTGVENPEPSQGVNNEPIDNLSAANILRQFAQGAFNPGSDRDLKLGQYKAQLANQESPDFSPFADAYSQLDTPEEKQKLIGELASVGNGKESDVYLQLMNRLETEAYEVKEAQPAVVRGAVSALVLNTVSTSPAEMKSLAADLKKSQAPDISFQINVLKDHTPVVENWVARAIDSANDPEALRKEREFYTKDTGRTARSFFIEKDNGGFEEIPFSVGMSKKRAADSDRKLENALQAHTSFKKMDDFLDVAQGFLHQGAFAAIFSKTSGATGLTMSDFIRSADQPSFQVTLHRDGKIHIEGRMDTNPSAIDQDSNYLELDAKQSSLSQSFQLTLTPTTLDGQTKVDCELREAEVKGTLHRANLKGGNQ